MRAVSEKLCVYASSSITRLPLIGHPLAHLCVLWGRDGWDFPWSRGLEPNTTNQTAYGKKPYAHSVTRSSFSQKRQLASHLFECAPCLKSSACMLLQASQDCPLSGIPLHTFVCSAPSQPLRVDRKCPRPGAKRATASSWREVHLAHLFGYASSRLSRIPDVSLERVRRPTTPTLHHRRIVVGRPNC